MTPGDEFYLTYDEYYGNKELVADAKSQVKLGEGGMIEKSMSFKEYADANKSDQIFDNDLLEQEYKFWETKLEKEQRLKKLWIDMKRKNALGGIDAVGVDEHSKMNEQIVELIRKIRWKTDQELVRRNHRPLFH